MGDRKALITAASGIGDILRVTPLIRVCSALGYDVDVLLSPDYAEASSLLDGAPEIRRLFFQPSAWSNQKDSRLNGLASELYEVATFTHWSAPLRSLVRARTVMCFDVSQWLREGDTACVEKMARQLGWRGPMPKPFVCPSDRHFGLPPGTIALHPGCKPGWSWKKWHGFEDLSRMLPHVVIVGTSSDLDSANTYFGRSFSWPSHVANFVGNLSLRDTAALLSECAALVSNDSGLMHVAVALGIPAFGIFGITSPRRECIPAENMFPITKGLSCEPACRQRPWGRRDCDYHLRCLKTLAAPEVLEKVQAILGNTPASELTLVSET
jgi:ADP-heptose:LPS heptosyltransferase